MIIKTILAVVMLIFIVYQLVTGELITRHFRVGATRARNPIEFWVTLTIQSLFALWIIIVLTVELVRSV